MMRLPALVCLLVLPAIAGTQPSSIALAYSGTPVYGATLSITATIAPASATGFVTFVIDGQSTLPFPIANGIATSLQTLAVGTHTVSASYSGDATFLGATASAPLTIVVDKAPAVLSLSAPPAQIGQRVLIRAAVSLPGSDYGTPAALISFMNGANPIPGCAAIPAGVGCATTFANVGLVVINAVYPGDAYTKPASATLSLDVAKVVAGVYTAVSPDAPVWGGPIAVNALLLGANGVANPTGAITFYDRGAVLGSKPIGTDGRASLSLSFAAGSYSFTATYNGDSNYQVSSTTSATTITVAKAPTTTAISAAPAQLGQRITVRASVHPGGGSTGQPAGTVDFTLNGLAIAGCSKVTLQSGDASCTTTFNQLGSLLIGAAYSGDVNTTASSDFETITINKVVASLYLAWTPTAPVHGEPVSINALALGADGVAAPTGSVTFSDGSLILGTAPLGTNGRASISLPLTAGAHRLIASYSGDALYQPATFSSEALTIGKAVTTTTLTAASGGPWTAIVTANPPGAGSPAGAVQFLNGGAVAGIAPLVAQGATSIATLISAPQTGTVTAAYQGDANFLGSLSGVVTVSAPSPVVVITADRNPAHPGDPVTFTVAVVPPRAGGATPTGSVTLSVDSASLGASALIAGQATFTGNFPAGSHAVLARYSGDSANPAASGALTLTVMLAATSMTVTSSQPAVYYGQPVTLTAHLPDAATGTVHFTDASTALGASEIRAAAATLTVTLPAGSHTITAAWPGDGYYAPASAPIVQTVSRAYTSTVAAISAGTVRAIVTAVAPATGTPTGTVQFVDSANKAVAAAPLAGGIASASAPSTATALQAIYSGDANFLPSTSVSATALTATNAASYASTVFAADEIVTLFGPGLSTQTLTAAPQPASTLGGASVRIIDRAGAAHPASLLFVSPAQASILMPSPLPPGLATLTFTTAAQATLSTAILVTASAPGLFTADGTGKGSPAAELLRIRADGTRDQGGPVGPIDLSDPSDTVYLILYGTGLRNAATKPTCTVGGQPVEIVYAGAQPDFPGLDQVNVFLPPTFKGAGDVQLILTVDGVDSNPVTLTFP